MLYFYQFKEFKVVGKYQNSTFRSLKCFEKLIRNTGVAFELTARELGDGTRGPRADRALLWEAKSTSSPNRTPNKPTVTLPSFGMLSTVGPVGKPTRGSAAGGCNSNAVADRVNHGADYRRPSS